MELLIRLLLALLGLIFAFFVGIDSSSLVPDHDSPPIIEDETTMRQPILIDNVDVQIMESFPVQVTLDITGTIQDGCQFPVMTEIGQDGTTITVEIFRIVPMDAMCPMMIQSYNDSIPLGALEPGSYTININDTTIPLDI